VSYAVLVRSSARRELVKLPPAAAALIDARILAPAGSPRPLGCKKLAGGEGWRVRVGDYRVVYEVDDAAATVTIVRVAHRREVYR
jgi:mRNA interferase RelE/StbE